MQHLRPRIERNIVQLHISAILKRTPEKSRVHTPFKMLTRTTRWIFWSFLSCAVTAVDQLETVTVVPVFPGEIVYFLVGNTAVSSPDASEDEEVQREPSRDLTSGAQRLFPQRRCSVTLLTVRALTLLVAIGFLLFHRQLCTYAPEPYNCTIGRKK